MAVDKQGGSKQWQRHWETHVDLLEDEFTGPLYKTVYPAMTFSVSKINEIVATAVTGAWVLLGLKYLAEQDLLPFNSAVPINGIVLAATVATAGFALAMLKGYGRGRFGHRKVSMYARSIRFDSEANAREEAPSVAEGSGDERVTESVARRTHNEDSHRFVSALVGLLGAVAGATITLVTAGYVESSKQTAVQASDAIANFAAAAWGGDADGLEYTRALSRLSVYAPPEALEAIRAYNATECAVQRDKTRECRAAWAQVISLLRSTNNLAPLSEDLVIDLIWGPE